ncbi:hypothetical protein [Halomonas alimentaria]|uniref:Response regulatory domain-containing protein n=1 Tax=Halomonas alimentaria TaxID=147248 RepID=A0A7X5APQ9_9GAMM|nr:hypothetical protein [Halomonas alimentaria]NAW33321.1 hypothetical protein [Halomonas alimentaria]
MLNRLIDKIIKGGSRPVFNELTKAEIKDRTKILFIDDNKFKVIDILKNNGWRNTQCLDDIEDLDDIRVRESHILFIDIHGVGRGLGFSNEGLGLVKALKERYPEKKVVVYSSESKGDRFEEGFEYADSRLKKNVDPIRFLALVDDYSDEFFSLDACANRLKEILREDFKVSMTVDEVKQKIYQFQKKGDFSEDSVSRAFNIGNAGSVASIIGLFLGASS